MKRFNQLMLFVSIIFGTFLLFTSCGSDDDDDFNEGSNNSNVIGSWQAVKAEGLGIVYDYEDESEYIVFKKDGGFIDIDVDEDGEVTISKGTWTAKNNGIYVHFTYSSDPTAYSIIKNLKYNIDIIELTSSKLIISCNLMGFDTKNEYKKISDSVVSKYIK